MILTQLLSVNYNGDTIIGFNIAQYEYIDETFSCKRVTHSVSKEQINDMIKSKSIVPINFAIIDGKLARMWFSNQMVLVRQVAKAVRNFLVNIYCNDDYDIDLCLCGSCIEASEYIVAILKSYNIKDAKSVEGWCLWDDDSYGTDVPYGAHTWVEIESLGLYVDVTADQFNYGMDFDNKFPPIMIRESLHPNMVHEEPIEGSDY